jgi:hypothetical protein
MACFSEKSELNIGMLLIVIVGDLYEQKEE